MKVIILKTNEIKEVADGYARNYLFPQKLAISATADAIKKAELAQKEKAAKAEDLTKKDKETIEKLSDKKVTLKVKANEEGGLFAALTGKDIASVAGITEEIIKIKKPIKKIGEYEIDLEFKSGEKGIIKLEIIPEK
ncbi:50S ribosomal protein L9 [Patescibacteria group bacterium]|nr:50S ribosomal protein L9 [Patescibacteria group bacterium]MBU1673217.1 50S ribosomal protein L9 [Patescibacteria group bacterium]MBU1964025.1 50S ribosomal protein L9 [Patescibacteria group bacterium]